MTLAEATSPIGGVMPPQNAKQRVYLSLKADIVKGLYGMGDRLSEGQLATKYGVSKTPVREALALLQQEGLVEVLPRVGYLTSRVTLQDVDDIFDLRMITEAIAAERAAKTISPDALERLDGLQTSFHPGDRESYLLFLEENREFHLTIAEAAGNRRLVEIIARLIEQQQRLITIRLDLGLSGDELVQQHRQILAALHERNPVKAREAMVADISNTYQDVLNSLKKLMANWHI